MDKEFEEEEEGDEEEEKPWEENSPKLDPSDVAVLQKTYGDDLSWYLNSLDEAPKKTASGAFVIPSRRCFETCQELIFNSPKPKAILGKATNHVSKLVGDESRNVLVRQIPDAKNLTISFSTEAEKYSVKPPNWQFCFSHLTGRRAAHKLNSRDLVEEILKTDVGDGQTTDEAKVEQLNRGCIERIHSIISKMQVQHAKCQYLTKLQEILKKNKQSNDVLGITLRQFRELIYYVFAVVVPKSLFGNHKNTKILRYTMDTYFLSPYKAPICLKSCVDKLNISKISWLESEQDTNTRRLVIAKLTKWLFESFFIPMIRSLFHERKSVSNGKRILVSAKGWKIRTDAYIDTETSAGRIVKVDPDDEFRRNDTPSGRLVICPKSKDVRSICRLRYTYYGRKEVTVLKTFLQQQYLQRYNFVNMETLHSTWLKNTAVDEEEKNHKLQLVNCHVSDAFGSIIQKTLFDIVNGMINEIPDEYLLLQWYELILPNSKSRPSQIQYRQWFSGCPAVPIVPNRALIGISTKSQHEMQCMRKEYIRSKLEDYIFEQTFSFRGELYKIRKGIVQGSPLSPILSDIYYQHMTTRVFGIFMQSGSLLRYVDDFLYITKDEYSAQSFLELIEANIPEYNCNFPEDKITTNVEGQIGKVSEWVPFMGLKLNGDTKGAIPDYETTEIQNPKWMKEVAGTNSLSNFAERSLSLAGLRLKDIVLDPKMNSASVLCESAGLAARKMATRCMILVSTIFDNPIQYRDDIMNQIRGVVKKLEIVFRRRLTKSGTQLSFVYYTKNRIKEHFPYFRRMIVYIPLHVELNHIADYEKWPACRNNLSIAIWQSFFQVFTSNAKLRKLFCQHMKFRIRSFKEPRDTRQQKLLRTCLRH